MSFSEKLMQSIENIGMLTLFCRQQNQHDSQQSQSGRFALMHHLNQTKFERIIIETIFTFESFHASSIQ